MKRGFARLITVFAILNVMSAMADTTTIDGVKITYSDNGSEITITRIPTTVAGRFEFPSEINGKPVTVIESSTASGCTLLEEIVVPKSVERIGQGAFSSCNSLSTLEIPFVGLQRGSSSPLHFGYIFGASGYSHNADYVPQSLKKVIITDESELGSYAFYGCKNIEEIVLPESLKVIRESVFQSNKIKSITLPDSVETIGSGAFKNCALTNVVLSASLEQIGNDAFRGTALKEVVIPGTVRTIGTSAFSGVISLTKVTFEVGVEMIGSSAFSSCINLTSVEIPGSVRTIDNSAFSGCTGLQNLVLHEGVESIGGSAFWGCSSLTKLSIPKSVKSIGTLAFYECSRLEELEIPFLGSGRGSGERLSYLWTNGDTSYPPIKKVLITDATSIGSSAFVGCNDLTSVQIDAPVESIGERAFENCTKLTEVILPDTLKRLGSSVFNGCGALNGVKISEGLSEIPDSTFYNCQSLAAIVIPSTVKHVGSSAFAGCSALSSLVICPGVETIYDGAFNGCRALKRIEIPKTVTRIGSGAFSGCDALEEIVLPFVGICRGRYLSSSDGYYNVLGYVFGSGSVSQYFSSHDFSNSSSTREYAVPKSLQKITITDEESISFGAFSGLSWVKEIEINDGIAYIGARAFYGCQSLVAFDIPKTTTRIGTDAFMYCEALATVSIPASVNLIEERAFEYCTSLVAAVVKPGCTSLGKSVFYGCTRLESVAIPYTVTTIGADSFSNCAAITNIVIPSCVKSVKTTFPSAYRTLKSAAMAKGSLSVYPETFAECSALETVTIPESVSSIGTAAFCYCASLQSVTYAGDAPSVSDDIYFGTPRRMVSYVMPETIGWNGGISTTLPSNGLWPIGQEDNRVIRYIDGEGPSIDPDPLECDVYLVAAEAVLEGGAKGTAKVSVEKVKPGETVTLTAKSGNAKSFFAYWLDARGEIIGLGAKLTVVPTRSQTYRAVFRTKSECVAPSISDEAQEAIAAEAMVGVGYETIVKVDPAAYPVRFSATKLPTGLKIDATTGVISGVPVRAGTFVATIRATSRANASKSVKVTLPITVSPLPNWAIGTFTGVVSGLSEDDVPHRALAKVTVSSNGRMSGSLISDGVNYAVSSKGYDKTSRFTGGVTNLIVSCEAKRGANVKTFAAVCAPGRVDPLVSSIAGTIGSDTVETARSVWRDAGRMALLAPFVGVYTVQLMSDGECGHGYLSLTVDASGTAKAAGKLADGTAVSASLPLLWDEEAQAPYAAFCVTPSVYKGGYAFDIFNFGADGRVRGSCGEWVSLSPTAIDSYGAGFAYGFTAMGAYWNAKEPLEDYYRSLTFRADAPDLCATVKMTELDEDEKAVAFTMTELQGAAELACWDRLTIGLDAKGTGFVAPKVTKAVQDKVSKEWLYEGDNDAELSFSFAQATGIFKGSFTCFYDYVSAYDAIKDVETLQHVAKKCAYEGALVRGEPTLRGFYLWDMTAEYEDDQTGAVKTYTFKESRPVVFE